ncbi:MAG TPA: GNAT family N-acetyltransferase [Candidatus Caenarcaniphilales bacterium]|nr:GNAT family N-acetyltransferase [Candidatus Caenarcaniphilales bacterium]
MATPSVPTIVPTTPDRWSDVAALLDGDGEGGCWCQAWRGKDEVARATAESRPQTLRRQMEEADPPPGYIAYLDGVPVGWVGVSVRAKTPRLLRSRTIPAVDDQPVWSIGCFRIRPGYRRRGVATALLAGVVNAARRAGAPGVEAYPIDPERRRVDVGFAFVGIASMFDAAGFRRVQATSAHSAGLTRLLVRLDFDEERTEAAATAPQV